MVSKNGKMVKTAGDVFWENIDKFKSRFQKLRAKGVCYRMELFGSIARGYDREDSDIDLAVYVTKSATDEERAEIVECLENTINFPIHVTLRSPGIENFFALKGAIEL